MTDDPPRRSRADARRNRERLLGVADAVFREQGTDASLEEVARRAGVGIGTLYRHFPVREALLEALLHERFESLRAEAARLAEAHPPEVAVDRWLRLFVDRSSTYRGLPASVLATLRAEGSPLHAACHAMTDAGTDLITAAQRAGAVRADVRPDDVLALAGAIAWLGHQAPDDADRPGRLLAFAVEALTGGPGAPLTPRPPDAT